MWRVYGEQLFTANFTGGAPQFFQKFVLPADQVVICIRSRLAILNDPAFSTAEIRIYSDRSGLPQDLLFTSQEVPKAKIHSQPHALKEIPFIFSPRPMLKGGDSYHAALYLNDYVGDESSHVAWVRGFPDPINPKNRTASVEKIAVAAFDIAVFGGKA